MCGIASNWIFFNNNDSNNNDRAYKLLLWLVTLAIAHYNNKQCAPNTIGSVYRKANDSFCLEGWQGNQKWGCTRGLSENCIRLYLKTWTMLAHLYYAISVSIS